MKNIEKIDKKPKSTKAKSYRNYRHKSSQDHGDAHQSKGHDSLGYWEGKWEQRGPNNADKTYLKEVIRAGLDDYYGNMNQDELEREADLILANAEENETVYDLLASSRNPRDYGYYDSSDGRHFEADYSFSGRLKSLEASLKDLKNRLSDMPGLAADDRFNQQRFTIEAEINETVAEIRELLGESEYPTAAYGLLTKKGIEERRKRAATLDDYEYDDFGDDFNEVTARIQQIR